VKNDGTDIFSGTGTACAGTETGYMSCIHAGQMRKVPITGTSSCSGLSMTDSLGVFSWECTAESGTATFYNYDFKSGKGLADLVNATSSNYSYGAGDMGIENSTDNGNSTVIQATQTTVAVTGTLESLSFYVPPGGAAGNLVLGVYSNSSSKPGTLLATTASFAAVAGWNTQPVTSPVSLTAGTYWLAFQPSSDSLVDARVNTTASYYKTHTYGSLPASFGTGTSQSYQPSFFGTLNVGTGSSWKSNSVTLTGGSGGSSTSGVWGWTNPVLALPDNHSSTGTPQFIGYTAVYVPVLSTITAGYGISGDHVAFAVPSSETMTFSGYENNSSWCNGGAGQVLCLNNSQNFLWFEGIISGEPASGTEATNIFNNTGTLNFSRFHNFTAIGATSQGIQVNNGTNNILDHVKVSVNQAYGLAISGGSNNLLEYITASLNFLGVMLYNSPSNNALYQINAFNNEDIGLQTSGNNNYLVQGIFSNNVTSGGNSGFWIEGNNGVTSQITANNNANASGLYSQNVTDGTFNNLVFANNTGGGLSFDGGTTTAITASQIVATNNSGPGITSNAASTGFYGVMMGGNNTGGDCATWAGGTTGIINSTCTNTGADGSNTYTGQASTAVFRANRTLASSFVGKVTTTDTANASNTNGTASWPTNYFTFDWLNFSNIFRGWGIDGSTFPNANNQGEWILSGTGRIWDWSLKATDTVILNTTGNGSTSNGAFTPGSNCPAASDGNVTVTDAYGRTYLLNAMEVMDPFSPQYSNTGNHNGLCETGETCIYTPNFGAYQGEGTLSQCTFVQNSGAVSGVTMWGYSTNGD